MNRTLIPDKSAGTKPEERELMLLLNKEVANLFEQAGDPILAPSPEMNHPNHWDLLETIRSNQDKHCGYWFKCMPSIDAFSGALWLNCTLSIFVEGTEKTTFVSLTPNQTHWILNKLKQNPLLRQRLETYLKEYLEEIRARARLLSETVSSGAFWDDMSRNNAVFDVTSDNKDAFRRGWYTAWDILLKHILPPPTWVYPFDNAKKFWDTIKRLCFPCT